jgi:processive 1,2-diacylglycerol beta-glucosyltransferase
MLPILEQVWMAARVDRMKRVLLLSVSAGAGHQRAAEALVAWGAGRAEMQHWDVLDFVSAAFRKVYADAYIQLVTKHPEWWRLVYNASDRAAPGSAGQRLRRLVERGNTRALVKAVQAFRPDRIICTHFLPAEILGHEIARGRSSVPVYVQVTDFDLHPMWVVPGMAGYFAANQEIAARLLACGPTVTAARVTGIPVMPAFDPGSDPDSVPAPGPTPISSRAAARRDLMLDADARVVLLMGGGGGVGGLAAQAEALLDLDQAPVVVALAGRSAAALADLQGLAARFQGRLIPMGFTDQVPALMRAADLVVTKPGGLSTSECLALGLPMILSAPIPGQEERNADYLLEEGAALKAIDVLALRLRAASLLNDPPRLARMAEAARRIGRPHAARDVLDQVLA